MKKIFSITLLLAAALAGATLAAGDDAEPVAAALTLTASNFVERSDATLTGDELQIAPTGSVACALSFVTNQTCTVILVARAEAATALAVQLDSNTVATAQITSTNLASHNFSIAAIAGTHQLRLAPAAASTAVFLASVTLIGAPLPQLAATNQIRHSSWDEPVGR